jgi:UPF0755 protein
VSREERYRRYGRERSGGSGRTVLWLALIVVMAAAVGLALAREALDDDAPAPAPAAETAPAQKLLIREGLRREDIAAVLDEETSIPGARYLALTGPGAEGRRLARTSRPTSLEGFLFPATYEITDETTARDLVDQQLAAYASNAAQVNYAYARSKNLTRYDVLILASMIEREVAVAKERPIVAGVMYNRLKAGMRLDIDATVQYALGEWKPELTGSDLEIDSPYNTRRFAGLPPGPISNPGVDSIRAAAKPARVPYLYYVARNDGTGRHYFATTPEQFEADVARSEANAGG